MSDDLMMIDFDEQPGDDVLPAIDINDDLSEPVAIASTQFRNTRRGSVAQDLSLMSDAATRAEAEAIDLAKITTIFRISIHGESFKRNLPPGPVVKSETIDPEAVTAQKFLVDIDDEAVATIRDLDTKMKAYLRLRSLRTKTLQAGLFRFPKIIVEDVVKEVEEYIRKREAAVQTLCNEYERLKKGAQKFLKTQWNADDYPHVQKLKDKYVVYATELVIAVTDDVAGRIYSEARRQVKSETEQMVSEIRGNLRAQIFELVSKTAEMFKDNSKGTGARKFHKTLIPRLNEFVSIFEKLDITNDAEARSQIDKIKAMMEGIDTEKIKTDDDLRRKLQQQFSSIVGEIKQAGFEKETPRGFADDDIY